MQLLISLPCLLPLCLAPSSRQETISQDAIHDALDRGGDFLVERFRPEKKAKRRPREREGIGMRALVLYAMLSSGVPKDDPSVRRILLGLSTETIDKTYDATCMILALCAHDPLRHLPWIRALAGDLIEWQKDKGDWGYPDGPVIDLSNTQYAALGLWKAAHVGVHVPLETWTKLCQAVFTYQDEEGAFSYMSPGSKGTGSMTTAGVAVLAICELELSRREALDAELDKLIQDSKQSGIEWLRKNFTVDDNPAAGAWHYYYLYGLERMGGLTGISWLGDHHWYQEGARLLLEEQDKEGSWMGGTDLSETSFALLFLKRATSSEPVGRRVPVSGAEAHRDTKALAKALETYEVMLGTGQRPGDPLDPLDGSLHLWIDRFSPKAIEEYCWQGERVRGPRIERVLYRIDDRIIAMVLGDPARPAGKASFNARVFVEQSGDCEVVADIVVSAPSTAEGGPVRLVTLTSGPLSINVQRALPAWVSREFQSTTNLSPRAKPSARPSSYLKKQNELPLGEYDGDFVIDGMTQTPWLSKAGDETPSLSISYRNSAEATRILIHALSLPTLTQDAFAQPTQLVVKINGKEEFTLTPPADHRQPTELILDKAKKIKRLDIDLLGLQFGETEASRVSGLGEVELYRD